MKNAGNENAVKRSSKKWGFLGQSNKIQNNNKNFFISKFFISRTNPENKKFKDFPQGITKKI